MPVELLVILGAEVAILGFVAAMTFYAKRKDVLSGRSFERPVASPSGNRHLTRSIRRKARDLLRLTKRWGDRVTFVPPDLLRRADLTRMRRWILLLQTRLQKPFRFETRARGRARRLPMLPAAQPCLQRLAEAGRNTDAHGTGAGSERVQSSANRDRAPTQRSLNARSA